MTLPARDNFFHSLSFGIDYKHFGQIVGLGTDTFSSPITYYPLNASYGATWQNEGALTQLNAAVTGNIRGAGSNFDEFFTKRAWADANFVHLNVDLSHTQDLPEGFQLFGRVKGQVADGPLVSSEQFSIGGVDTVRGYLESESIGDNGAAATLEIRTPDVGTWLQKNMKDETGQGAPRFTTFNEWRFFGFVDAGVATIYRPLPDQKSEFDMWSYGIGTRFKMFNYMSGMVALAVPVIQQSQGQTKSNDPRVIFNVTGEFLMTKGWLSMCSSTQTHTIETGQRGILKRVAGFAVASMTTVLLMTSSAQAWWNDDWSMRKQISVDTSSTGANITDPIGTTPVLIRLHAGNFRFASAKDDGSDLRFVAGDDKTPLKYHVEKYEGLLGEALVWVNVPNVQPGAKANIWLYYGNQKAPAANDAKGTYDSDTLLVYHFAERGTPALDSSVWSNNAQSAGQSAEGSLIGNGLRLDGRVPLTLPASPSLALSANAAMTWSAWFKPASLQRNSAIYSRRDGANALVIGLDDGAPFVELTTNGTVQRTAASAPVAPGGWHHLAMVATPGLVTLYLDGNAYASLNASLPALNSIALVGGDTVVVPTAAPAAPAVAAPTDGTAPDAAAAVTPAPAPVASAMAGFAGDLDDMTIAKTARAAGFVKFFAVNQGMDPSKLILFSGDEETSSWLSSYFGVLLKAVTLDGWIVIGILMIMGVASWIVMFEKNGYLARQRKANEVFIDDFRHLQDDLTLLADGVAGPVAASNKAGSTVPRYSSLYRIYQIGADEIRRRFPEDATGGSHVLSAESIAAIRAALDAGLVREMQALNRLMVILTIAISGGPFLGLLGTVIGVMITFAAIAMSGDVNINAIAPGVAGALMATVAGLVVAIPALFGYNWLTLRIKDITSDMQVFVDEFTTKMAEVYSTHRPGPPIIHHMAAE